MKKTLFIEKLLIYILVAIGVIFAVQLLWDCINYGDAARDIKNGDYAEALVTLEKLEGFRDSEKLRSYCEIMCDYDPENFVSVYHCYRDLKGMEEPENDALALEIAKTRVEVETLYKHYNISLSVK